MYNLFTQTVCINHIPMPRTKQSDDMLELELRITPCDGLPITDWKLTEDHHKFIAFEEGGNEKRLHYHCYIEYKRSRTYLLKWIYTIAHCNNGESGNTVFFSRKPHDHTFGYISKQNKVSIRHNIDDRVITEWFKQSTDYVKSKERDKKRSSRSRQQKVSEIIKSVQTAMTDRVMETRPDAVISRLVAEFRNRDITLPTRNEMERFVLTLMSPYDEYFVRQYYEKFLLPR